MQKHRPVMLVVLDGWGWRDEAADNAVRQAGIPNFDHLWSSCPHALVQTSGLDVGLPHGQMGNSEVGHLNIGAGRIVMQDLPRISAAIADGEIKSAPALTGLLERLRQNGGTCHLLGLVSPGGVHSHHDHGIALAKILAEAGVFTVVHAITDGRDTAPRSADEYISHLGAALPRSVPIVSVCGRYYAMDRDGRWERVAKAYYAIVEAEGPRFSDALAVIAEAHANDVSDEFVLPAVVGGYGGMRDGDGVLCLGSCRQSFRRIPFRTFWARWWPTRVAHSCAWPRRRSMHT
jgi:2,3-bisphosphoglycerate-independent phosphoglycerate mutase